MAGKAQDGILGPGFSSFWGFLNVSLRAPGATLGLEIIDQMWVQFRMGSLGTTTVLG